MLYYKHLYCLHNEDLKYNVNRSYKNLNKPTIAGMVDVLPLIEMFNLKSTPTLSKKSTLSPYFICCCQVPCGGVRVTHVMEQGLSCYQLDLLFVDWVSVLPRGSLTAL